MKIKSLLTLASLVAFGLSSYPAMAQDTAPMGVQQKLDKRKADFQVKASDEKNADYAEGLRLVAESGVLESAKNVGDKAPDFTLPSALGENITLSEFLKDGPVVLIWYRGEWCPYCNIYLEDLQAHADEFKALGAKVVAISPEKPDRGWTMQDRLEIRFEVLSDMGNKTAADYGVAYKLPSKVAGHLQEAFDIHEANSDESNVLPLAVSYVINQEGVITYAFIDPDYRKRAETSVLLDEVKKLAVKEE